MLTARQKAKLAGLRILVVDDEDTMRAVVCRMLVHLGAETIFEAKDGHGALDFFHDNRDGFDLVFCDWMMPALSGLDVLTRVRALRPDVAFVMLTAHTSRVFVEQARDAGVDAYVAKPLAPRDFTEKLGVLLDRIN